MSLNYFEILKRPLITERTAGLKEKLNQYVFKVDPRATKPEIRTAVQEFFKVEVEKVRTANYDGKIKRLGMGRPQGRRSSWKKAIITLKQGQEIKMEQENA